MEFSAISIILLFLFSVNVRSQKILPGSINTNLVQGTSMFEGQRDGIVVVNLDNGKQAVICNELFTDVQAGFVCRIMGFPSNAASVVTKRAKLVSEMTMIGVNCTKKVTDLSLCTTTVVNETLQPNFFRKCNPVHVFCLEKRRSSVAQNYVSSTKCDKTPANVRLIKFPGKQNSGYLQLRESTIRPFRFVCNKRFDFDEEDAEVICRMLCVNPINPHPVMYMNYRQIPITNGYFGDLKCYNFSRRISQCHHLKEGNPCPSVLNIGLKCGEEPEKKVNPPPNVICVNRTIVVEWSRRQTFLLNSSLVSMHENHTYDCNFTRFQDDKKVTIEISLDSCNPIMKDNGVDIIYQYTLIRKYISDGPAQFKTQEPFDIFCEIPKSDAINKRYKHGEVTYPPLTANNKIEVDLTLHTDSSYRDLLPRPYQIKFNSLVYLKATIREPLNMVRLGLTSCSITSVDTIQEMDVNNSIPIIENNCPSKISIYKVETSPVGRSTVRFQFNSFKLADAESSSINIFRDEEV